MPILCAAFMSELRQLAEVIAFEGLREVIEELRNSSAAASAGSPSGMHTIGRSFGFMAVVLRSSSAFCLRGIWHFAPPVPALP
jgi:hypothetical protein